MKYKQPRPGFELVSPGPLTMTVAISPWAPPSRMSQSVFLCTCAGEIFYSMA